jgi:PAS domain S-box-containing protein
MTLPPELRILALEDVDADADLMAHALRRAGVKFQWKHVKTKAAFEGALGDFEPDVILADFSLPGFDGRAALQIARENRPAVPVIMVSGSLLDEAALDLLLLGAKDYVLKANLTRLGSAVQRAVTDAEDIRERQRAQELLAESESRFRGIVETAQEGIWMFDGVRTTYMNRRMAEMLGLDANVAIGIPVRDLVDIDSRATFESRLDQLSNRGAAAERIDCHLQRTDGTGFWATIAMSRVAEAGGHDRGFLAMVTDVTAQRKLQEQLMVSDRMASVGTLAASVAHEINNPLAAMMGNLQLALSEAEADGRGAADGAREKDLREELSDAMACADRIRVIVRDLRIFGRAQEETSGSVDIRAVVESSLRMARNEIHHRALVTRDLQAVPRVLGTEARLGQVFLNLLVNAAQSIDVGHADTNQIAIGITAVDAGQVVVEIRDTGCGMTPETVRRAFEPFFTTKAPGVGTGLGLPICRQILADMGARIDIESARGSGTVVRVSLPVATDASTTMALPVARRAVPAPRRARILVVDDELMIGHLARRALSGEHDVFLESSGRSAIGRIAAGDRFDVILCDLMMPEVTGMDLHGEVSKLDPRLASDMVFMSGGAFTPDARAFLAEVPNARIEKPFNLVDLRNVVNARLLDRVDGQS